MQNCFKFSHEGNKGNEGIAVLSLCSQWLSVYRRSGREL